MAGIIYLDIDDEITSAAARVRAVDGDRVAVVVPHGSRVATSRINFRLLARDALTHERRLSVVAADAATRALAASAGLPVFASVAEYEGSLVGLEGASATAGRRPGPERASARRPTVDDAARVEPISDPDDVTGRFPTVESATASTPARATGAGAGALAGDTARIPISTAVHAPGWVGTPRATGGRRGTRTSLLVGLAVVALAFVVGGVAAYALLPSATVVIVPRTEPVTPLSFAVTADPAATATDSAAGIVPAERIELAVETSDTFEATGKRVVETKAKGTVTFQSFDPGGPNTIPARSVIATEGGIQFRTTRSITLPAAQIVPEGNGAVIIPTRADVSVEAVKAGEAGSVPSNAITLVPRGENPTLTKVRNADPTEGGSREEFPKVVQADIDAALTALQTALSEEFAARLADPSIAPAGTTLFATTAALGPTTTTVDPATFLDQEIATFELGLSAIGTVVAADPAPVTAIAEERLLGSVSAGRELVPGSVRIKVGEGSVSGGEVRFPVTASAMQVGTLDPVALEALILGKPIDEARRLLAGFGDVELMVWPDWVTTVPTLEARVEVRTERAIEVTTTTPSPAP